MFTLSTLLPTTLHFVTKKTWIRYFSIVNCLTWTINCEKRYVKLSVMDINFFKDIRNEYSLVLPETFFVSLEIMYWYSGHLVCLFG